jgi:hypothetical protein
MDIKTSLPNTEDNITTDVSTVSNSPDPSVDGVVINNQINLSIDHVVPDNLIGKTDNDIICKYCHENTLSPGNRLTKPCKCTDPVCIKCLGLRNKSLQNLTCEICKTIFNLSPNMTNEIKLCHDSTNSHTTAETDLTIDVNAWDGNEESFYDRHKRCAIMSVIIALIFGPFIAWIVITYLITRTN